MGERFAPGISPVNVQAFRPLYLFHKARAKVAQTSARERALFSPLPIFPARRRAEGM